MQVDVLDGLAAIEPAAWNALVPAGPPFLRHEFLAGLEDSGCVGAAAGWRPRHLVLRRGGRLVAAVPLYLKSHSFGEYVFDWAWADAYARAGLDYYPKLVAAVPFTPVSGPRLLAAPDADARGLADALIDAALALAETEGASSLHWLFLDQAGREALAARGFLLRRGHQFHWHNRRPGRGDGGPGAEPYKDFDDFLAAFPARRRKKIRRERRRVAEAGIRVVLVPGEALAEADWALFHRLYLNTLAAHGARPYFSLAGFLELGRRMPEAVLLAQARQGTRVVAGALFLRDADALYGRYWGSLGDYHSLHFETCYYAPIEHCIRTGLDRFEAGAQGEHKFVRGFLATPTWSAHWLRHPDFAGAVADFLRRETRHEARYLSLLSAHAPYKAEP